MKVRPERAVVGKIPDSCAIAAIGCLKGGPISGSMIKLMLEAMKPRYNGLGAGFAGYGIYPDRRECYALHLMFENMDSRKIFEKEVSSRFRVWAEEEIPTRSILNDSPILWRYFIKPIGDGFEERLSRFVMWINWKLDGAYILSSGRNMGVFKGLGDPSKIADFYRIEDYEACLWLGHGRYPTNSPGWWGGAHPFNLLDYSVVHNGEISSYGIAKRYLESKGYRFIFLTDSELFSYAFDFLLRVEGLSIDEACRVLSPPFWMTLNGDGGESKLWRNLRIRYQELNVNGPFSIAVALRFNGRLYLIGLTDRLKLRPLTVASNDKLFMISSEECGIRAIEPNPKMISRPRADEPIYMRIDER
ncbi:MAG: glutamine amidotransferase family protein [Thaumarchaeota archaeon]|nr:glutamine amidotransferase family protein [Nitrososphaerota archaeon]